MRLFWEMFFHDPERGGGSGGGLPMGSSGPGAGNADFADLPPTNDGSGGDTGINYIEDAMANMLADDVPDGLNVNEWQRQQQPQQPQQPQYPGPAVPPGQRRPQAPFRPQQPPMAPQNAQPQQPQQPQAPTPPVPAAPVLTPEQQTAQQQQEALRRDPFAYQAELIANSEAQYVESLAQNVYAISDQDMDAFLSGDSTKVSQALARVHLNAVSSAMRVVSQHMPVWVGNMLKVQQASRDRENEFWTQHPYLDRNKHHDLAMAASRTYRQMHPQASLVDTYRIVGAMVAAAAGIQPTAAPQRNNGQGYANPNGVRTPGRVVRQAPSAHQPAGMQGVGGSAQPMVDNQWAQTAEILMADEAGMFDGVMS